MGRAKMGSGDEPFNYSRVNNMIINLDVFGVFVKEERENSKLM